MEDRKTEVVSTAKPKRRFLAGLLTGGLAGALLAGTAGFVAHAHDGSGSRAAWAVTDTRDRRRCASAWTSPRTGC